MARMAQTTAAPPAMSSFIRSMPSAGLIEMPPVSNVMPLPTSPRTGDSRRARRLVLHHDHARRFDAAARDAEQQAHAEPLDRLLVEHFDVQPGVPGDLRGAVGEDARRQHVRRLVAEARARLQESPRIRPRSTACSSAAAGCRPFAAATTISSAAGPRRSPVLSTDRR